MQNNKIVLTFPSYPENENLARNVIGCFALRLNPSIADISDIKTAVSEAVTNSIVHGYPNAIGEITMEAEILGDVLHINIFDGGVGIKDVAKALEPFYSESKEDEHSGMGFTIMQTFMDNIKVESSEGLGTKIYMEKTLNTDNKKNVGA